jgi:hypothetical protein
LLESTQPSLDLLNSFQQRALIFLNAGALLFPVARLLAPSDELFAFPDELLAYLVFSHRGLIVASGTTAAPGSFEIAQKIA